MTTTNQPIVVGVDRSLSAEQAVCWAAREAVCRNASVQRVITPGRPVHSLLVQTREAQLVVVGCRGRGGVRGMLLGSTSQALLHHSSCPVAVVRPESGP